jgi:hypothetical protein
MEPSRFEVDSGRPAERKAEPPRDQPGAAMRAPRAGEDDQRRDETPEEPGYGHGV